MGNVTAAGLPEPATPEGRAGLAALLRDPGGALVGLDYDGTLAPIVADPLAARAHPGAAEALRRLSTHVGTVALITGRPAGVAVELGGLRGVPRIVILGHYGAERWESGVLSAPHRRPALRRCAVNCPPCWPAPVRRPARGSRTRDTPSPCTRAAPPTLTAPSR